MAVTAYPLASKIAADLLSEGGNAAAAGVGGLAALSVAEPHASGLGGGGFALYYDAATKKVSVIDYRETAPAGVIPDSFYQPTDSFRIHLQTGGSSVLTPGSPYGWQAILDKYSNRKIDAVLKPVIDLAEKGYKPSIKQKKMIEEHADQLASDDNLFALFLDRDKDLNLSVKKTLQYPALARTYRNMAAAGTFYHSGNDSRSRSDCRSASQSGGAPIPAPIWRITG